MWESTCQPAGYADSLEFPLERFHGPGFMIFVSFSSGRSFLCRVVSVLFFLGVDPLNFLRQQRQEVELQPR